MRNGGRAWGLAGVVLALAPGAAAQEIVVLGQRAVGLKASEASAADVRFVAPQVPSELLNRLPGVAIHRNNGVENLPAIRSPVFTGGQSAGSFLVLEDGIPIRAPGFANVNQLWEAGLEFAGRVALVRGPGGAAYGSNAVHGLVDVQTPARFGAVDTGAARLERAELSLDSLGYRSAAALVNVRAPQTHAVLVGLSLTEETGWRDASGLDRQGLLLRYRGEGPGGWSFDAALSAQNLHQETASFIEGARAYENRALARTNPTPEAYRDARLARGWVKASLEAGDWALSVTPFARWIEADLNLSFFPSRAQEVTRQAGGGAQLRAENRVWSLGLDVERTRGELSEVQRLPTIGTFTQGLHYDFTVDMDVLAAFAEARVPLGPDWRVIAGLRGEAVRYAYDTRAPEGDVSRFRRPADRTDRFSALTPKLGLVGELGLGTVYLNLARGARPPQITDLYALQTTQTPGGQGVETLDSVEAGLAWEMWGGSYDLALYHMDKRDGAFRNAEGRTVTGADTRHQGVELSCRQPVLADWLHVEGWASYARHTYRFTDPVARAGESIRAGDDIDSAPRRLASLRLVARPRAGLTGELEWTHMGRYLTNAANTRAYPGHEVLNARAALSLPGGAVVSLAVRNLTDAAYAERADFAFGQDRFFPGAPRSLSFGLRFGGS